jgi:threonine/homoserine/homoserine lactone efflux protein
MNELHAPLTFALVALLVAMTPGPNMVYLASRAVSHGRRAGVVSLLGVALAFMVHVAAASTGISAVVAANDGALTALRWAGVAYLCWLGLRTLDSPYTAACLTTGGRVAAPSPPPRYGAGRFFLSGFLINALNPMVVVFFVAVLPQFITHLPGQSVLAQSLALGLTYTAISVAVNLLVTLSAARTAGWITRHPQRVQMLRQVSAAALLLMALRLGWQPLV